MKIVSLAHYGYWTAALVGSITSLDDHMYVLLYDHQKGALIADPFKTEGYSECVTECESEEFKEETQRYVLS